MSKHTPVEWLIQEFKIYLPQIHQDGLLEKFTRAKEMEKEREYETKAFWFGRGINAGREGTINELKPVKS